jgi:hypothetical protein
MPKIWKNQSRLRIRLTTGINLTGATCKIKYRKPNQTKGEWDAVVIDVLNGVIEYNVSGDKVLDIAGEWKVKAYCVFDDGSAVSGQIAAFKVYNEEY